MAKPTTTHKSIWSTDFKVDIKVPKTEKEVTSWPDTFGKVTVLKTASITRTLISPKRNYEGIESLPLPVIVNIEKLLRYNYRGRRYGT